MSRPKTRGPLSGSNRVPGGPSDQPEEDVDTLRRVEGVVTSAGRSSRVDTGPY